MAKSTIGGKSKGTNGEPKARRAPVRRRIETKTTGVSAAVASAADLARADATVRTELPAAPARTRATKRGAVENPSPEAVQRRAYELYLSRGGNQGGHLDDWFEAERQLRGRTH